MTKGYSEIPDNWGEIQPYVNQGNMVLSVLMAEKCIFYDTCSFRYHANLEAQDAEKILQYIRQQNGIIIITRCILMELASYSHLLEECYIRYIRQISDYGIEVYVIYEEELRDVMDACFTSKQTVNDYLIWAVRMVNHPVSMIEKTFQENEELRKVMEGRNKGTGDLYTQFFQKVRSNKESGDNLGEELIAVCLQILTNLPEENGKFCVITDDKGAAGKIDASFRSPLHGYRGKRIILFTTPKLAQILYQEEIVTKAEELFPILRVGNNGTIRILGTEIYDVENKEITLKSEEAARKIVDKSLHIIL